MSRTTAQVDARLTTEITTRAAQLQATTGSVLLDRIKALETTAATASTPDLTALEARVTYLETLVAAIDAIVCPPKP
jgi:hypothetical protein